MRLTATTLEIEREGDIPMLKPPVDVLGLGKPQIETMVREIRELLDRTDVNDVVLDLRGTHPIDSQTQRLAVELWKTEVMAGLWQHASSNRVV